MATEKDVVQKTIGEEEEEVHRIRISLTSRDVKKLEKTCSDLKEAARNEDVNMQGPVRMPTKRLRIVTRKAPNGEGTNTYDKFEMRIHKRLLDLRSPAEVVRKITAIKIEPGVEVEVIMNDP